MPIGSGCALGALVLVSVLLFGGWGYESLRQPSNPFRLPIRDACPPPRATDWVSGTWFPIKVADPGRRQMEVSMDMKSLIPWGRNNGVPVTRADVGSPFLALHRQMDRLFDDFFRDIDFPLTGRASWHAGPNIEVNESEREYKLVAELPGLDDKDVEVTLRDGVLTLRGEKKAETNGSNNGNQYSERWYGKFERCFSLGPDVDADKVSASFRKGVLTIIVGKQPDAQTRVKRIPVAKET